MEKMTIEKARGLLNNHNHGSCSCSHHGYPCGYQDLERFIAGYESKENEINDHEEYFLLGKIDQLKLSCSRKEMELSTLKSQKQRMREALKDARDVLSMAFVKDTSIIFKKVDEALKEVKE